MIPVKSRPRINQAYPCPRCNQLISPQNHICFHCAEKRTKRNKLLLKKAGEGGMPFYIIAAIVGLFVLYLALSSG